MSMGTVLRIGFDAKAVQRGFALLPKMFSKSLGFLGKNVLGGAAQKLGHGVTDLLGKAIMAVPSGIKEMMEYAGAMDDLSRQTGVATKDLILLDEAMRLSGADGDMGRTISTFAKNLRSAMTEEGAPNDAIRRLGFEPDEFKGMKVDQAFTKIGMRVKDFNGDMGELDDLMSALFGGRMGYKLIRFFKEYDSSMEKTRNNVGDFAEVMNEKAGAWADIDDALGRYRIRWMHLMEVVADAFGIGSTADPINKAFDWLNPEKVRAVVNMVKQGFSSAWDWLSSGKYKTLFEDMGRWIGDGLKASMGEMLSPSSWFRPFTGKDKPATQDKTTSQLIDLNRQQARSLAKIESQGFPAYAV